MTALPPVPAAPGVLRREPHVLITGGAGFIGCNLADRLARDGRKVLILDSLHRPGVESNLQWLRQRHPQRVAAAIADVRQAEAVRESVERAEQVFHLAAQVAVTCSLADPVEDFEVNARGTLNVLQAVRQQPTPPALVFASTNKVYGRVCSAADLEEGPLRYRPRGDQLRHGFDERQPLDFASPYGCSKGCADQYVIDHARVWALPCVVLRLSCVYGTRQFGTEDQGWVAHFLRAALLGSPITIYGDGKQVRDLLWVGDLVEALLIAAHQAHRLAGRAFNLGGGSANTVSLLEVLQMAERACGRPLDVGFEAERIADQRYYVSDSSAFAGETRWRPRVGVHEGLQRLLAWLGEWTGVPCPPSAAPGAIVCVSH